MKNKKLVILGGYVNAYSIVRELYESNCGEIYVVANQKCLTQYSNMITKFIKVPKTTESVLSLLKELGNDKSELVIYPTSDDYLKLLNEIHDEIQHFCYLPFNREALLKELDKEHQYLLCEENDVPYPKSISVYDSVSLDKVKELIFPLLLKPNEKNPEHLIFRGKMFHDLNELKQEKELLLSYINKGFTFILSEYIPGDDTNIFAYTGFKNKRGKIVNGWSGKKMNQFPDKFGIFSSSINIKNDIVIAQGEKLLNAFQSYGILEPEFKYDYRDKKYKLTEVNLRSMMWHRSGKLCGVSLHKNLLEDALGIESEKTPQDDRTTFQLVYLKHEILNLLSRKGYWKFFKTNVLKGKVCFAVFNMKDIKPFLFDLLSLSKNILQLCRKKLRVG